MKTVGLVLAGGAAKRFPGKLHHLRPDGISLLDHVVKIVSSIADEIYVVVKSWEPLILRGSAIRDYNVLIDNQSYGCKGPLAAVLAGLETQGSTFLIVAADYGFVTKEVLEILFNYFNIIGADTASYIDYRGFVTTTLTIVSRYVLEKVASLCMQFPKHRISLIHRLAYKLLLVPSCLATTPWALVNINDILDLVKPSVTMSCPQELLLLEPPLSLKPSLEPHDFLTEARYWLLHRVFLFAKHAAIDALSLGVEDARNILNEVNRKVRRLG